METHRELKSGETKLALVADKNRRDNLNICRMLEEEGFGTASVFDFDEALVLLQRIPVDLLVIDAFFDDAMDIVDVVRSDRRMSKIPILFIRNKHYYSDAAEAEAGNHMESLCEN